MRCAIDRRNEGGGLSIAEEEGIGAVMRSVEWDKGALLRFVSKFRNTEELPGQNQNRLPQELKIARDQTRPCAPRYGGFRGFRAISTKFPTTQETKDVGIHKITNHNHLYIYPGEWKAKIYLRGGAANCDEFGNPALSTLRMENPPLTGHTVIIRIHAGFLSCRLQIYAFNALPLLPSDFRSARSAISRRNFPATYKIPPGRSPRLPPSQLPSP
jgi:hypothetical protein